MHFNYMYLSFLLGRSCNLLLATNVNAIMLQIPLLEGRRVDLNNGALDQRLSPNKLIVGCIVHHIKNPCFASNSLTPPRIVPSIKPQSTPLHISTTNPNSPNCLVA